MSFVYQSTQPISTSSTISVSSGAQSLLNNGVSITVPASATATNGYILSGSNGLSHVDIKPHTLQVQGTAQFDQDAEFKGNITVKGVDIAQALKDIEARLNILRPNLELEAEWNELKELGERYRQMERDMLEKQQMIELLKKKY